MAAGMTRGAIMRQLAQLKIPHKHKTQRYEFKVWLEKESDYSYFFLMWQPLNSWQRPELIYENYTPPESTNSQN